MVRVAPIVSRAIRRTSSSASPRAAAAPAAFHTKNDPARPRRPLVSLVPAATSSVTISSSTRWPASRASSIAISKFSTSPA